MKTSIRDLSLVLWAALILLEPLAWGQKKIDHFMEIHGEKRNDEYFWMKQRDTKPVLNFLNGENKKWQSYLHKQQAVQKQVFKELKFRADKNEVTPPIPDRDFVYFSKVIKGKQYPVLSRKRKDEAGAEEVLLDENIEAKGKKFYSATGIKISPDQKSFLVAVDLRGRQIFDLFVVDIKTKKQTRIAQNLTPNFEWAEDGKNVFYTRQDPETLRSFQLYRVDISKKAKPELVFEEKDARYELSVSKTRSRRFLLSASTTRDSSEWRFLDAQTPTGPWKTFLSREMGHEYSIEDSGNEFLVVTNWKAPEFRMISAPVAADSEKEKWTEVLPERKGFYLLGVDAYKDFWVVTEREKGLMQLRVLQEGGKKSRVLNFDDGAYSVAHQGLPEFDSKVFRLTYTSLVQPNSVYEENAETASRTLLKTDFIPGYDKEKYVTERRWAKAKDGALIPMSVVRLRDRKCDGTGPGLLYGYGAYGIPNDPAFDQTVFSLVDRGYEYILTHTRGGSEMGRFWYEQGRLHNKINTFTDFIASAEDLIQSKCVAKNRLAIQGGSAGGLLMGGVMNMRPDLFNAVLAEVPFVDVLTTMLDDTIPLTPGEYREWGNPNIKEQYMDLKEYSPYDNVVAQKYPHVLVTTGYHDSQVQYWEPAKWVARLHERKTDKNLLFLRTDMSSGHGGASGRFDALGTIAEEWTFVLGSDPVLGAP